MRNVHILKAGTLGLLLFQASAISAEIPEKEITPVEISVRAVNHDPAEKYYDTTSDRTVLAGGTTLLDVFRSVEEHAPQLIRAEADIEFAIAQNLKAESVFDPRISGKYSGRLTGFYGGQVADIAVQQRLQGLNAEVYGGYTISSGRLPVYEDELLTNEGGEIRAGAKFALLRGRAIDPERTKVLTAKLGIDAAKSAFEDRKIAIKSAAAEAYVNWVFAQSVHRIYRDLYEIAEARGRAIDAAIKAGELAAITRDENRQLLLARQSQLYAAIQSVAEAQAALSLFLRDELGKPATPVFGSYSSIPQGNPFHAQTVLEYQDQLLEKRPDLIEARTRLAALKARSALAENDLQPDLDFSYEYRRDFGDEDIERIGTDHKVGLEFKLPLGFNKAQGENAALNAEMKALKAQIGLIEDQASLALFANQQALAATEQQLAIGKDEISVARMLREAEEKRYLAGISDVFRLNVQETAFANSQLRFIEAQRAHDVLLVDFYRLTGQYWTYIQP